MKRLKRLLFVCSEGLSPDGITSPHKDPDHGIFPFLIVRLTMDFGAAVPDTCKESIIRAERPDILDPSCPSSGMTEDEKTPAPIVPADLRAGLVNRTVCQKSPGPVPEERAGVRQFFKDTFVIEEIVFVGIHRYRRLFTGIIVIN